MESNDIKNLFKTNWNFYRIIIILLISTGLFLFLFLRQCSYNSDVEKQTLQNVLALKDSIHVLKNKAGDMEYFKKSLVTDKENLKLLSQNLYNELQKLSGDVRALTLSKIVVVIKDTLRLHDTLYKSVDGAYNIGFNLIDSKTDYYRILKGYSKFYLDSAGKPYGNSTFLTKDSCYYKLSVGFRERGGYQEAYIISTNPYMSPISMESAIIDPKLLMEKSNFSVGLAFGFGVGMNTTTFKFIQNPVSFLGISLNYSLFDF